MKTQVRRSMALDFHENSKSLPSTPSHYDKQVEYKVYPNAISIPLEIGNYNLKNDTFLQALFSRKSTRAFTSDNIKIDTLSKLLTLSCGRRSHVEDSCYRTYASAGARYPIEVYAVILQSSDISAGVYHYNVCDNTLELIRQGDFTNEVNVLYGNQKTAVITAYPCLLLFSMVAKRSMQKYGERGYRFTLLDAGHMSQNLYLVSEYLKLGIVAFGGGSKNDNAFDDLLGLSSREENVFYGFAVGHPAYKF